MAVFRRENQRRCDGSNAAGFGFARNVSLSASGAELSSRGKPLLSCASVDLPGDRGWRATSAQRVDLSGFAIVATMSIDIATRTR